MKSHTPTPAAMSSTATGTPTAGPMILALLDEGAGGGALVEEVAGEVDVDETDEVNVADNCAGPVYTLTLGTPYARSEM